MILIKNGMINTKNNDLEKKDILIDNNKIIEIADSIVNDNAKILDADGLVIMPGMIDPHVHLREPGFEHKETIKTASMAALKGGYTTIFAMPNLKPVPSTKEVIVPYLEKLKKDSLVNVIAYASITLDEKGEELVDFKELKNLGIKYFSDDGRGVQDSRLMKIALEQIKNLDLFICSHCEQESLLKPGASIYEGERAKELGLIGMSNEVESQMVKRDLALNSDINANYHICHISAKESVDTLKYYKERNQAVSAEVTMHHLLLNEHDVMNENHKMNPPLKSVIDQKALIKGIIDNTIEIIASDHAPHTLEEKSGGIDNAMFGIVGLETTLALAYTYLVKTNLITLEKMIKLTTTNAAKRFKLSNKGSLKVGFDADITIVDLNCSEKIDVSKNVSLGKNTPFDGYDVNLKVMYTLVDGKILYKNEG